MKNRIFSFPGWGFHLEEKSPDHCAVLLQPVGERRRGIEPSLVSHAPENFLFTVWSEHRNSGMRWNKEQNSVDDRWGQAPPRIRPVRLSVYYQPPAGASVRLFALDPTGARKKEIQGKPGAGGVWEFIIDTGKEKTFWFEGEIGEE